jgi:hypothetical protein
MPPEGLEHSRFPEGKPEVSKTGGSKSGNNGTGVGPLPTPAMPSMHTDAELAKVVAAWPDLPPAIRAGILALVGVTRSEGT